MTKGTRNWSRLMRASGWQWIGTGWQHRRTGYHERQWRPFKRMMLTPPPF